MAFDTIRNLTRREENFPEGKTENQACRLEHSNSEEKSEAGTESQKGREPNMVTIDRTKAENFLIVLAECLDDVQAQKELVEKLIADREKGIEAFQNETIIKFNTLIEATCDLKDKIIATESYENYLAEQVKNTNLQKEVVMLEQQLQKEKAEISKFIINTENFITTKIGEIENKVHELKSADEIIEMNISKFKDELKTESAKCVQSAENIIEQSSDTLIAGAKNQMESLKAECGQMLKSYTEKCQQHLETVKKQSIDFLRQCETENKKLIEKVPEVANSKISKKDVAIYAMAGVSIASLLVQMLT